MKHTKLVIFTMLMSFLVMSNVHGEAFKEQTPSQYFDEMIKIYKTSQEGTGPIPVDSYIIKKKNVILRGKPQNFKKDFDHKNNFSAVVMSNGKLVFERYSKKYKANANFYTHSQSMAKSATGLSVGSLMCNGQIASLDDKMGKYSKSLAGTLYANVSIRNALQMRSGINKKDYDNSWKVHWKMTNNAKYGFKGKNDMLSHIKTVKDTTKDKQGKISNYSLNDTLALSLMVSEITGAPMSKTFYDNIFVKSNSNNSMFWLKDNKGVTLGYVGLYMTTRDWANIGNFMITQMNDKSSCLGNFINEGVTKAVKSTRLKNWLFGYHFWVTKGSNPKIIFAGYGGQTVVVNKKNNTVVAANSLAWKYGKRDVFGIAQTVSSKAK